ncbi:MAG TPA: glutathione S-transferase [Gammaproteobacteria bacterium]|nr:glutathione S-transferase [Gammaproteobacteria bacterium]
MSKLKLYGERGWGSAIVEAQLAWYGLEYELELVGDLFKSADARRRLESVNPLAQVPTLVLADGTVMTESAAITLYLADVANDDSLVPRAADPLRPAFLRWLIFLVANVYPTYTYADDPSRFVAAKEAQQSFRDAVDRYACRLYSLLEREAREPWFLGGRVLGVRRVSRGDDAMAPAARVVRRARTALVRDRDEDRGTRSARGRVAQELRERLRRAVTFVERST